MSVPGRFFSRATLAYIWRDPQRKPLTTMFYETAAFGLVKRHRPGRYFRTLLYRRGIRGLSDYLSSAERDRIWAILTQHPQERVLKDKLWFHEHFRMAPEVCLPRHLGHMEGGVFHFPDGTTRTLAGEEGISELLTDLLTACCGVGAPSVFAKVRDGLGGGGAYQLTTSEPPEGFWQNLQRRGYVFQQTVAQHPDLEAVYPRSLNTMRITTCRPEDQEPVVATAWIRFGRGGAVVDNGSSGGIFAGVDLASGRTHRFCGTMFDKGGETFTHHPDTGHSLLSLEIPQFEAALEMALAAARRIDYPLVGWDIAISPGGPVLIEGNSTPDYYYDEVANGGYFANPVLGPYLRELLGHGAAAGPLTAPSL